MGRPCRIGGLVITEIRERDDAVKEGNDGDAEKIDTRQADVMILVGDEGEFGRCGGLCVLFSRGGFLRFKRRERAQGFFGNTVKARHRFVPYCVAFTQLAILFIDNKISDLIRTENPHIHENILQMFHQTFCLFLCHLSILRRLFLIYFFTFRQFGLIHLFPSLLPGTHKTSLPLCVLPRFATFSHFNYSYT